jgi:tRNA(Ile)-lysidine synthase
MLTGRPTAKLDAFETGVLETIRAYAMLAPGEHAVVAVSGGADSIALLLCLHALAPRLGCDLRVAHLNHCLRGKEGEEDEAFVRHLSAELGLPYETESIEVQAEAAAAKQNLEQAAREKRYDFLRRIAEKTGRQKIAVGHTRDDQAETALFRFIRGSGIEGLSAIHPVVDGRVIRPLIECSRESVLQYLKLRECGYRNDSSNADLRYSRNRIRRELVPYLEEYFNPNLVPTLAREALLMRETWDLVHSQAVQAYKRIGHPIDDGISMKIAAIEALHPALQKQVVRCALRHCLGSLRGISLVHIDAVLSLGGHSQSGGRILLPHNAVALRQFDDLLLLRSAPGLCPGFSYELEVPGYCYVAEAHAAFRAEICKPQERSIMAGDYAIRAFLEPSALKSPLIIRSRMAGDRYGGTGCRKVKKMLIDAKVPLIRRDDLPMVVSGREVIWIPGFRPAKAFRAVKESKTSVLIEVKTEGRP